MTTLAYTYTLTAGQPENVNQLNQNLNDIRGVVNGGLGKDNMLSSFAKANVEGAFSTFKTISDTSGYAVASVLSSNTTYWLWGAGGVRASNVLDYPSGNIYGYLSAGDYTADTRTTYFRLRAAVITNGVSPASTFTFFLANTSCGGNSEKFQIASTGQMAGTQSVAVAASATNVVVGTSAEFTSTPGTHAFALTRSAAPTAGSSFMFLVQLQMRQV